MHSLVQASAVQYVTRLSDTRSWVDETRPAVAFPSRNHAQSSSTGNRSVSESSPIREQQLPAQDSREVKIKKDLNLASVTNNGFSRTTLGTI